MSTTEVHTIRKELVQWIDTLNDASLLNLLNSIRLSGTNEKDWWDELTEAQKENIRLGLAEWNNGQTLSSEEFWNPFHT